MFDCKSVTFSPYTSSFQAKACSYILLCRYAHKMLLHSVSTQISHLTRFVVNRFDWHLDDAYIDFEAIRTMSEEQSFSIWLSMIATGGMT